MGTFCTEVLIANPQVPDRRETYKLLVDTGSAYTWVAQASSKSSGSSRRYLGKS